MTAMRAESRPSGYAHPDVVVSTGWVEENMRDPCLRVVEGSSDALVYDGAHIPGAVHLDWKSELHTPLRRDIVCRESFEALMARKGIPLDATVVLYGDHGNQYATYVFWVFKLYGHQDVRIMDGGRTAWEKEQRPWSKQVPSFPAANYRARDSDLSLRAYRDAVFRQMEAKGPLVDARSEREYQGELPHPEERVRRGGHIPGARNIPWQEAIDPEDGTFKRPEELEAIYGEKGGIVPDEEVITYCHGGERASHTWFVLTYLLGYANVRNYDGSWAEWGSLIGAPIER